MISKELRLFFPFPMHTSSKNSEMRVSERSHRRLSALVVVGLFMLGVSFAAPRSAQASLIEIDLNAPGDKLLTLDTSTGLEWLDITETAGLNYFPAEATVFVTSQGFRHATQSEVSVLLTSFGIPNFSPGADTVANLVPVKTALDFMGNLNTGENHFHQGIYELDASNLGLTLLQVNPFSSDTTGFATLVQGTSSPKSHNFGGFFGVGHYLVRTAVPEPSSFTLLGFGCVALVGYRWRKRKQAA